MWGAIANMIIKASDNINRGVENTTKSGDGNNGQDYQIGDTNTASAGSGYTPTTQDTSAASSASGGLGNTVKNAATDALGKIKQGSPTENATTETETKEDEKEKVADVAAEVSDERLKNIFGENEDIIKIFAKIDAIQFTYKDKAHNIPDAEKRGVDDDLHYGIKAQDLEKNPLTASAVVEDDQGNKLVDTKELTTINSAVISEICKRLEIIEKVLGIKVV